jgi:hypothetical protein
MKDQEMTKRRKLALALAAATGATCLAVSHVTAFAGDSPQNFVVVSNHSSGFGHPTVFITEYNANGTIIGKGDPWSGSYYWLVDPGAAYVTVANGHREFRIPQGNGTLNQATSLPECFRLSYSNKLHWVTNQKCTTHGASKESWARVA